METLGQILYATRTKKKLTASEAAKGTRIKIQHIQAIEKDDFSSIAAPAYAKGFIKIYAEYLEIDPEPLIKEYMETHAPKKRTPLLPDDETNEAQPEREPRRPFRMPALPKIPWDKIKIPKDALPRLKLPVVPPRRLLIYSGALILFLLFLFTTMRCGRAPDETDITVTEPRVVVTPPAPGEPARPDRPLPVVDRLPEPYLE